MKLVVGLGNPGREYRDTRHNIGFEVVDELARRWRRAACEPWRRCADALVASAARGADVLVAKPQTFMNLSGEAVGGAAAFYKMEIGDVLVVVDEVALPLGRLRARARGSAGGHNGLKSIVAAPRHRRVSAAAVGVGRGDPRRDLADHVLAPFEPGRAARLDGGRHPGGRRRRECSSRRASNR